MEKITREALSESIEDVIFNTLLDSSPSLAPLEVTELRNISKELKKLKPRKIATTLEQMVRNGEINRISDTAENGKISYRYTLL